MFQCQPVQKMTVLFNVIIFSLYQKLDVREDVTMQHYSLQERAEEEGGQFNSTYTPPWVPESIAATIKQTPDKVPSGERLNKDSQ